MRRAAESVPGLGAASDRRDLERRIVMILNGKNSGRSPRRWLLAAGLLAVLALPAWTLGRPQDKADPKRDKSDPLGVQEGQFPEAAPVDDVKAKKIRYPDARRQGLVH